MLNLNTIHKELKDVPANRLEEIYQFIHALTPKSRVSEAVKKKILSFSGILGTMSDRDYVDFLKKTKETRSKLFDRDFLI